jgi:hypothetical protein
MNTLYPGMKGSSVRKWQTFLRGLSPNSSVVINGEYDIATLVETKSFQSSKELEADGIVGPRTLAAALKMGFDVVKDTSPGDSGPNWPPRPPHGPLTPADRSKIFGRFSFQPAGVPMNPEAIRITDDWASRNIARVAIPRLAGLPGSSRDGTVQIHQAISGQFSRMFDDWNNAGLSEKILTWGGSWVPRFIRGSRTSLSNHSWGTAFDINVAWNGLGVRPALKDERGSVRELVEIAYQNGFYWGGWFPNRPDGMHFEAYKIV